MIEEPPSENDTAISSLLDDVPEVLEFESWWCEHGQKGGQKRYLSLSFSANLGHVEVLVDDAKAPISIHVLRPGGSGSVIRAWDLYIGATIDILGRPTTLMAASRRTLSWLDSNAISLWKRKKMLELRLNKFRDRTHQDLEKGLFKRLNENNASPGGCISLRRVAELVIGLQKELAILQ